MPVALDHALVGLLRAAGRERDEPRPDAADRQAVSGHALLRRPADDLASAKRGLSGQCEARPAFDAADGPDADLSEAEHQPASEGPQNLSLSAAGTAGGPAQSGLVHGYYLFADETRLSVSGCDHGLVHPQGAGLANIQYLRSRVLCRGIQRGGTPLRGAGDHEQRSRSPVYIFCLDGSHETRWHKDLNGWQGTLYRQHLYRTPMAVLEVRMRLSARLGNGLASKSRSRALDDFL